MLSVWSKGEAIAKRGSTSKLWVPANRTVWGYSEKARLVRDVRLVFDPNRLPETLGDDGDGKPSVITPKPASRDHFKTGQACGPEHLNM